MNAKKIRLSIILIILLAAIYLVWTKPINLGLDLQGGISIILEAQDTETVKVDNDALLGVLSVIRSRVDQLGLSEPNITTKGRKQIVVELAGITDPQRAISLIGETALLEFVEAEWAPGDTSSLTPEKLEILAGENARLGEVVFYDQAGNIISERPIILKNTVLTGRDLKSASPGTNSYGEPVVNIEFTSEGSKKFEDVTRRSVGKPLAIVLDGRVISAPNVNEPIAGGRAQISGRFTVNEMRDLVIKLKAGALPVPVKVVSNKIIGPSLGRDSIEKSKTAGIVGFVLLFAFMTVIYRIPGILASMALILYLLLVYACMILFNATLTLPGIAGLILTVGMAVDANIIIFERIREERADGQPLRSAIENGFSRAFLTILDSNLTTLLAALVLFWLGSGSIKGFAVTLSIGVIVSMFTAIIITRLLLDSVIKIAAPKDRIMFKG